MLCCYDNVRVSGMENKVYYTALSEYMPEEPGQNDIEIRSGDLLEVYRDQDNQVGTFRCRVTAVCVRDTFIYLFTDTYKAHSS